MIIKEAKKEDAGKLAAFYCDVFPYEGSLKPDMDPYPCEELFNQEGQEELIDELDVFYAEENENVLGCVMVEHLGVYHRAIINLVVHPNSQGQTMGCRLVTHARDFCIENSNIMFHRTEVVTHVPAVQRLNLNNGFNKILGACLHKYGSVFKKNIRESTFWTQTYWGRNDPPVRKYKG